MFKLAKKFKKIFNGKEKVILSMMNILLIDNHDSFTFILKRYLEQLPHVERVDVFYPEHFSVRLLSRYHALVISPGPGAPHENKLQEIIHQSIHRIPVLGVCLGMQALVIHEGGTLFQLESPFHGLQTNIQVVDPYPFFENLPARLQVGLYHSWAAAKDNIPSTLHVTSILVNPPIVQSIFHNKFPAAGVQFHPESHLTPLGLEILKNWFKRVVL
jgi:anthranilate synthase component 2